MNILYIWPVKKIVERIKIIIRNSIWFMLNVNSKKYRQRETSIASVYHVSKFIHMTFFKIPFYSGCVVLMVLLWLSHSMEIEGK